MSTTGVTYYKLENGYPGDVTKGCGLSGSEIDKNFHFLRGYDIKTGEFEDGKIILTRVNGDEIVIDNLDEFVAGIADERGVKVTVNEAGSYFDKDRFELHIALNYALSGETGTTEDFVISGFRIEHDKIFVGEGLYGSGAIDNPLRTNPIYETGFYKSVKEFIDFSASSAATMPTENVENGDRYLTYEKTPKYGLKYNTAALNDIIERLEAVGHGWRVPTADDWNGMLNAYEDCDWRDHGSSTDSGYYGKDAGRVLKDVSWPDNDPEQKVGFKILPTDRDDNGRLTTTFWSSTTDKIKEITSKTFRENNGKVYQKGKDDQESTYAYIRLVRDFDDGAYKAAEMIDGVPYDCVVLSSVTDNGISSTKIWTVQNAYFSKYFLNGDPDGMNAVKAELDDGTDDGAEWYYYINEWDNGEWLKKRLDENDCLVIEKYSGQPDNSEYIVTRDEDGNYGIENRTDKIIGDVLGDIQSEIDRLDERVDAEEARAKEEEEKLVGAIGLLGEEIDRIDDTISGLTESFDEDIERTNERIDDLNDKVSAFSGSVVDEIERIDNEIGEEAQDRFNNDVKNEEYILNAAGGMELKNNADEVIATVKLNGNFCDYEVTGDTASMYMSNEGWTLSGFTS